MCGTACATAACEVRDNLNLKFRASQYACLNAGKMRRGQIRREWSLFSLLTPVRTGAPVPVFRTFPSFQCWRSGLLRGDASLGRTFREALRLYLPMTEHGSAAQIQAAAIHTSANYPSFADRAALPRRGC